MSDVRASGDVGQVVVPVGVESVLPSELVKRGVDLLKVPRVTELDPLQLHGRFRRDRGDISADLPGKAFTAGFVQKLESIDNQIVLLANRHGRTPGIPAIAPTRRLIKVGAQKADDDKRLIHIQDYTTRYRFIDLSSFLSASQFPV